MVKFQRLFVVKFIALFLSFLLFQGDFSPYVYAQASDFQEHFARAKQDYQDKNYEQVINRLERLLAYMGDENKELMGKVYLLLGAACEQQGKIIEARKNYTLCKQFLKDPTITGLDFSSLIEYQNILVRKPIEKEGIKEKKKKFPTLLVVAGIAVVAAIVMLASKKKDSNGTTPGPQEPTTGSIRVESTPDGASIWLDGTDTGQTTTAVLQNITPGSHTVKLTKQGYEDYETTVNVEAGKQVTVSATLTFYLGFEWVTISAGEFQMGDNFNEGDTDERPVHTVYLDEYKISKYEVTFEQYDKFCEDTGRFKPGDEGWGRGNRPVINVSWYDAKDFCDWLSQKTGQNIHLPTEAQWEKAARGTDQRRYPWGNNIPSCTLANFSGCGSQTKPVGSHSSGVSPYDIHDMAGNVWEWCWDWYSSTYYSGSPYSNPMGPSTGSTRVLRGGSWISKDYDIRSASRFNFDPSSGRRRIGFRLGMD
jgi:formylglycine-generating enzyme required for sulfatase activity